MALAAIDLLASIAHGCQCRLELRFLVAAIGAEFQQEWKHAEQRAHQQNTAVAILDVSHMDDGVQQQAFGVYQDTALLALVFFPAS